MSRALLVLSGQDMKAKAHAWIDKAPWNTRVEFKGPRRTLDQNSALWLALTDIATQLTWHGQRYSPEDWKDYLMHALRRARWMPDEDGGMVPIGLRTSDLSKADFSDLLDLAFAFGARHGVEFAKDSAAGSGEAVVASPVAA